MSQALSKQTRLIVVAVVLIAAIFMIAILPFTVPGCLDKIQIAQGERIAQFEAEGNPHYSLIRATQVAVGFFFPFWTSLTMLAGVVLLFIVKPMYNGEKWARALTLLCLAIPSAGGAYMLVPYLNFAKVGISNGLYYMAVGLISYFVVVLVNNTTAKQKAIDFWVFLIMGVTAAESFSNGHAGFRIVDGHIDRPFYADGIFILFPTYFIGFTACLLLIIAIYYVGMRSIKGWYIALIAGTAAGLIGFATQTVRTDTLDYLYQGLMGLALVVTFLIPAVKARMIEKD
ncbi:MAG: hypothetical protein AB7V16_04265 [Vulcanibacillus sp.]